MPSRSTPKYTAGLADLPDDTPVPGTLEALSALVQRMSYAIVDSPLAPALQGSSVVRGQYGLASRRMLPPSLSLDSKRSPNFTKALFGYLSRCFPYAVASSCTVAWHRRAPLHIDGSNIGLSYVAALHCLSGGDLWTAHPFGDHGLVLRATAELCEFDSLQLHTTLPFEGSRCYVSYYCHKSAARVPALLRNSLLQLRVPLPTQAECGAMQLALKRQPALSKRKADGFKQWERYLNTLSQKERY